MPEPTQHKDITDLPQAPLEAPLREVLRLAVESTKPSPQTGTPLSHAPLIERAPALMPDAVLKNYETTAASLEAAADALEAEMQSQIALMREEAQAIRSQGASYAKTVELNATLLRDVNREFRRLADKLAAFRVTGQT